MKITSVKAVVTENDILSIIEEFVDVEGLNIYDIKIKDNIIISGKYSKLSFTSTIGIGDVQNNILYIKILEIKLKKLRIFNKLKNFALKKTVNKFSHYGLSMQGDTLSININIISKLIPKVNFNINNISVFEGALEIEVEDILYSSKSDLSDLDDKGGIKKLEGSVD